MSAEDIEKALGDLPYVYRNEFTFGHDPEHGDWVIRNGSLASLLTADSTRELGRQMRDVYGTEPVMEPTDLEFGDEQPGHPAATDAERRRIKAAMQAGWAFRYDPVRMEFTAARELHTSRKLGEIEARPGREP